MQEIKNDNVQVNTNFMLSTHNNANGALLDLLKPERRTIHIPPDYKSSPNTHFDIQLALYKNMLANRDRARNVKDVSERIALSTQTVFNLHQNSNYLADERPIVSLDELAYFNNIISQKMMDDSQKEFKKKYKQSCVGCGTTQCSLLQCTRCKKSYYCNKNCQANHWATHKLTCYSSQ
jgi:hypothetical protein